MELYYILIFITIINTYAWIIYIIDILKGKVKPNKITWFIYALAQLIGVFAIYYSQGFLWSSLPLLTYGVIALTIFLVSFVNKESYWELGKLDYICLFLAIVGLILWGITDNPLLAIILSIFVDFIASIPLLKKIYFFPETEIILPFYIALITDILAIFLIKNWVFDEYLFPLYLVLITFLLILAFYGKRIKGKLS